jgi:hypothetical protein
MIDYSGIGLIVKRVNKRRGGKPKSIYKTMALLKSGDTAQTSAGRQADNPGAPNLTLELYAKITEHTSILSKS